jgi:hypothetical protein
MVSTAAPANGSPWPLVTRPLMTAGFLAQPDHTNMDTRIIISGYLQVLILSLPIEEIFTYCGEPVQAVYAPRNSIPQYYHNRQINSSH